MKIIFLFLFSFFSLNAFAVNYVGFGGGNYVYAEQGNLYLNFDNNVFDHRSWTYDGNGFSSEIKVDMTLKTRYSSSDWEQFIVASNKSDGYLHANYIKQPYTYQNKGQYQHSFAWVGWALRGGASASGYIGRTAAWQSFKNFAAKSVGSSASRYVALGTFFSLLGADDIICESTGDCKKKYKYKYEVTFSVNQNLGVPKYYMTADEYADRYNVAAQRVPQTYTLNGTTYNFSQCSFKNGADSCTYTSSKGSLTFGFGIKKIEEFTTEKLVQDRDLLKYFDEVCAKYPSECVNEPTQGKDVRDVVLTGGSVSPVNVIGPPYTNPLTGNAQQDNVVIGGASSGIGINSGTNSDWKYNPSLGQSITTNPVDVTTIARPDLVGTGTVPVAKPNEQTGTKPETSNPSIPEIKVEIPDFCVENPNALSCAEMGTVDESFFDFSLPTKEDDTRFKVENLFSSNGTCPAITSKSLSFGTIEMDYQPLCTFAEKIRFIVLLSCILASAFIIFGRN